MQWSGNVILCSPWVHGDFEERLKHLFHLVCIGLLLILQFLHLEQALEDILEVVHAVVCPE